VRFTERVRGQDSFIQTQPREREQIEQGSDKRQIKMLSPSTATQTKQQTKKKALITEEKKKLSGTAMRDVFVRLSSSISTLKENCVCIVCVCGLSQKMTYFLVFTLWSIGRNVLRNTER